MWSEVADKSSLRVNQGEVRKRKDAESYYPGKYLPSIGKKKLGFPSADFNVTMTYGNAQPSYGF